jgi:hypothetical protein
MPNLCYDNDNEIENEIVSLLKNPLFQESIHVSPSKFLQDGRFFLSTCSPSRDYIVLPTDKESSPEGLSMLNMLPPFPTKFSHLGGCYYFGHLSVPILLAGVQKQCKCKVSCSETQYSSYF